MEDLTLDEKEDQPEQWELDEGIPQLHEPVIQKYFQGRDALIAQEDKQRSDQTFREILSPMAMEACAIVSQVRFEELQTVWGVNPQGQNPTSSATMMFRLAKEQAEKTKLFEILRRMPKGALLHCHLEAMLDPEWLIKEALATDGIHIAAPQSLHNEEMRTISPVVFKYTRISSKPEMSLWATSYDPKSWVSISAAADSFPDGGREGFSRWLRDRCTISYQESLQHQKGLDAVWNKFISCFAILNTLLYYEPLYRKFLRRLFQQLIDDNIRYVDLRAAFVFDYRREGSEEPEQDYQEMIRVFGEEIEKFQVTEAGHRFWGARMIWTTIRSSNKRDIVESMHQCIETKLAYPELIAGFDLVGQEDLGAPLAELLPILLQFRKMCAQSGTNIPFFLHAGETNGTGTETDHNLFDAILLGTRRLGHAFSLYKHPLLMNMVKERRICVECCPISNEILRLTSTTASHPLPAMLAHGISVALANDDPGVLGQGSAGLTHDFWQGLQNIESLGLEGLGSLAENSVRYAAFEDQDAKTWAEDIKNGSFGSGLKGQRMKDWKKDWERFVQWVVMEHGVDIDVEEQD